MSFAFCPCMCDVCVIDQAPPIVSIGKGFDLFTSFPAKSLWEAMKEGTSIEEAQLANSSLNLSVIEEDGSDE